MPDFTGKSAPVTGGATGTCLAILISPVRASVAMTLSPLSVVGNSLRLRRMRL
jgi:cation transport ATPase